MNGITLIRKKFGLTQQQVADWLGVSRSLVNRYEKELRSLPSTAVLRLARLEILAGRMQEEKAAGRFIAKEFKPAPERHAHLQRTLELNSAYCEGKARKLREELEALQLEYTQTIDWLHTLEQLLLEFQSGKEDTTAAWLQLQYKLALKKLEQCDELARLRIAVKLAPLEAMAKMRMGF